VKVLLVALGEGAENEAGKKGEASGLKVETMEGGGEEAGRFSCRIYIRRRTLVIS